MTGVVSTSVEASLRRLGTDYLDLFQLHGFDALTPVEEVLGTLDDLVRAGKIRYIGCSNFSGWHLMKSLALAERHGWPRYVAHQAYYSLIGREFEWELMPLGLDQGDVIIKRRVAQKMEFLAEDVSAVSAPTSADLKAWFNKNSARFTLPGLVTFRHLYFSPDTRGQKARDDAARALEKVSGNPATTPVAADRFMFQDYYADTSQEQVAKVFGSRFAETIVTLNSGAWRSTSLSTTSSPSPAAARRRSVAARGSC